MTNDDWNDFRPWPVLRGGGRELISPAAQDCRSIARRLDIESLDDLEASIAYEPWLDGVRIRGRVEANAGRLCGVSLEPFVEHIDTEFDVKVAPEGSPNAPAPEAELIVELDADDPPDVVAGNEVDLGAYIVEALSLALDPFPRAPGAEFAFSDAAREPSPFEVLSLLDFKKVGPP